MTRRAGSAADGVAGARPTAAGPPRRPRWIAPVGEQLRFLVDWLEPVLTRPGLTPVPVAELCVELGEADDVPPFEPFDALVGPVRAAPEGIVADVIPREAFEAIVPGARPIVVLARGDEPDPLEFVASEAVLITTVVPG